MKRALIVLAMLLPALWVSQGQAQMLYQEGRHYQSLPVPVTTSDPERLEVVNVFSYACPHCYEFEPLVARWQAAQPADVLYRPFQAVFNGPMENLSRAFYSAEALGVFEAVHPALFRAIHEEGHHLTDEASVATVFERTAGIDRETFNQTFRSFAIGTRVRQASQRTREYRVMGTPAMVVNGRYLVTAVHGHDTMLKIVDYLLMQERAQRRSTAEMAN